MKYVSQMRPILKRYGVVKAAIFGSVARGEDSVSSDLDLLVKLDPRREMNLLDFVGLKIDLENTTGRSVDLVQYDRIKPILRPYLLKDVVEIVL